MSDRQITVLLKTHGALTLRQLREHSSLSETTVGHHVRRLERDGLIEVLDPKAIEGVGRPAFVYALTRSAEGLFPKRYVELLEAVLMAARKSGLVNELFAAVSNELSVHLRARLGDRTPASIDALLDGVDYGNMLGSVLPVDDGWELRANNCLYHAMGQKFVEVCDLLPTVITRTKAFEAERIDCQRDAQRTCNFFIRRCRG